MVRTYNTYYFLAKYTLKVLKSHLNESTNSKSKLLCIYSGVLVNSFYIIKCHKPRLTVGADMRVFGIII